MKRVEIYTTRTCPFCIMAKRLLEQKGVSYEETDVGADPHLRAKMMERAQGRRTVPQIFIDGKGIGGCDELHALDQSGKLDTMLAV
ncbi:glutaredoxin 3 [Thioclava sp. BHET1]|uniref:glutaredoxin 3 n=1 Tax=Thioclava dalianensis TaxID=1185766 RepID=UPI00056F957A|nr:glutaredoxin 3 [Thioclava dalianensis]TMV94223.1 glutaredoxin 3 [Thioclava sp. BHET1]SFM94919.1 glutaredoxin 3 [Thioclava dalianensis]